MSFIRLYPYTKYDVTVVSVFTFLSYMSMLVPIVLVVGTKDCLQTNYGNVVHCCTKFHVCQLYMENILYSTLAHFPFFFDVVCTQVHCLLI